MTHESWNLTGSKEALPASRPGALADLAHEFDAWAEAGRGDSMERGHWPTARQALDQIVWTGVRRFLDLGCGNGYAVRYAATQMNPGAEAIGIDVAPRMVEAASLATGPWFAKRTDDGIGVADVRFLVAPFDEIPLEPGVVDVVFSNEALYYAPDVDAALGEVRRLLAPGGRFVCGLDYFEENAHSHDWPEKVGVPMLRDSVAGWTKRLEAAGFVKIETARLLDPDGVQPLAEEADAAARAAHESLVAWKTEVGTLLLSASKPTG